MGAGIAKSISIKYPSAARADRNFQYVPKSRLGKYSLSTKRGVSVINLYGQYGYARGLQTNYKMLEKAINSFLTDAVSKSIDVDLAKVGVPYKLGCGLAGGDWNIVSEILARQSELHGVDIYIYKL